MRIPTATAGWTPKWLLIMSSLDFLRWYKWWVICQNCANSKEIVEEFRPFSPLVKCSAHNYVDHTLKIYITTKFGFGKFSEHRWDQCHTGLVWAVLPLNHPPKYPWLWSYRVPSNISAIKCVDVWVCWEARRSHTTLLNGEDLSISTWFSSPAKRVLLSLNMFEMARGSPESCFFVFFVISCQNNAISSET